MNKFYLLLAWDGETLEPTRIRLQKIEAVADAQTNTQAIAAATRALLAKTPRATITVLEAVRNATIPANTPLNWSDLTIPT